MNSSKIQSLLEEFIADFQVKKDSGRYHLKSILYVIKHSHVFSKFLTDQLHHNLKNKGETVSKDELLKEFNDPDIRKYEPSEYEEMYDFLKGGDEELAVKDLMDEQTQRKRQKVEDKLKTTKIDRETWKQILEIGMRQG